MIARVDTAGTGTGTSLAADVEQRLQLHNDKEDEHREQNAQTYEAKVKIPREPSARSKPLPLPLPLPPLARPEALRRITYPESSQTNTSAPLTRPITVAPTATASATATPSPHVPVRPRNRSPYSLPYTPRGHLRSRSSNSTLAPPMSRTHSSPGAVPQTHYSSSPSASPALAPSSPLRSPASRSVSPFSSSLEDSHPASMTSSPFYDGGIESISEDAELDFAPRASFDLTQPIPVHATMNSARPLSVRRQRPASPLHHLGSGPHTPSLGTPRSSSGASSPSLPPGRFNENYPTLTHYASTSSFSSVPSTPTSTRSRSPSVSSLETIEDVPDAEWEAIEADRLAKLRAAAEADQDKSDGEGRRRGSLDIPGARSGAGFGFGRRGDSSRKRWSVCGGERRADLDLETIWED